MKQLPAEQLCAAYAKRAALDPYYGRNPFSYTLFAKLALGD